MNIVLKIIQTQDLELDRLYNQLQNKKIVSGQYFGGLAVSKSWNRLYLQSSKTLTHISLPTSPKSEHICPVVLGVGNGIPTLNTLIKNINHISTLVLIDTSLEMLNLAIPKIQKVLCCPILAIVADFVLDQREILQILNDIMEKKIYICLGYTAGNYRQPLIMETFNKYLNLNDNLLLELAQFISIDHLTQQAKHYASKDNCLFGLKWLEQCGHAPNYGSTKATFTKDPDCSTIYTISGYYIFDSETTIHIKDKFITYKPKDNLQFVESRRYPKNILINYLKQYRLTTVRVDHGVENSFVFLKKDF